MSLKLINNISERVVDDLKVRMSNGSRVSIAAASFSIYAFEALKKELEKVEQLFKQLSTSDVHYGKIDSFDQLMTLVR